MTRIGRLLVLLVLSACGGEQGPPLSASEARIFTPLPGTDAAVGYLTIENRTGGAIELDTFESPDFDRVELHETDTRDDVVRMRRLEALVVPPDDRVSLVENGKHFMLIGPRGPAAPGRRVTLRLGSDGAALIVIETDMRSRFPDNPN